MFEEENPIRVLYVEDHFPDARLVREFMSEVGTNPFVIDHVDTIHKAMERLPQGDYRLILLDMSLPDGSGINAVKRVISANPEIPVVVFTGTDDRTTALKALGEGAQDYLVKGKVSGELLVRSLTYAVERAQSERRVRYLATHDRLTDLPNRVLFFDRMEHAIHRAARQGLKFSLIILDLDGFKKVNDTLGHLSGDEVLRVAARRMKQNLRASDTIARWGGDEFAVIVEGNPSRKDAILVAEKIQELLDEPIIIDDEVIQLHASFGISRYPDHGTTVDMLIRRADEAMYHAKETGQRITCCAG